MTRFVLAGLILFTGVAQAQSDRWVLIREDEVEAKLVDFRTATRTGPVVKVWILTNNKVPQDDGDGKNVGSDMHLRLYDCSERQWRDTYSSSYALPDAKGTLLHSHTPKTDWRPVVPDSVGEDSFLIICERVKASRDASSRNQ